MTYFIILILLFVAELLYFRIADKFNIIDRPNERSSHSSVTVRGGGIVFYFSVAIYFIYSGFTSPWFFSGLTLISLVCFIDDVRSLSSKFRLLMQLVAITAMFVEWDLFIMPWYIWILALILCTGVINAFNFMDGINGITGGYSLVIAASLCYVNEKVVSFADTNLMIVLILSLVVFNFFNFRKKARCFAGDVGSVTVAFILLFLIGQLIIETDDFSYLVLLAVYGVDVVMTILHRIKLKEPLMVAHRKHLYQIMANELKMPHLVVSLVYMVVQTVIIAGYFLTSYRYLYLLGVIVILSAIYIIFMLKFFRLHMNTKCSVDS
ncbi:MAG: UDP-GlcNAc:UDP-phosphate GlcNAc-1-phosphate transferase [Bacteroidetes bacterium]|nr:UDP-GlcNAc:UDP-phosphate GlcNAc-1-phosphate transferase [Bacteroidota bacterium]